MNHTDSDKTAVIHSYSYKRNRNLKPLLGPCCAVTKYSSRTVNQHLSYSIINTVQSKGRLKTSEFMFKSEEDEEIKWVDN